MNIMGVLLISLICRALYYGFTMSLINIIFLHYSKLKQAVWQSPLQVARDLPPGALFFRSSQLVFILTLDSFR